MIINPISAIKRYGIAVLVSLVSLFANAVIVVTSTPTVPITGRAPVASSIALYPAAPQAGDTVTASWVYNDADGDDELSSQVVWLLDGKEQPATTDNSFTLPTPSPGKVKNLQVRITPHSAPPAYPDQGLPVTSMTVYIPSLIDSFTKPEKNTLSWPDADAYCKGLSPPARLPTISELQNLYVEETSATVAGKFIKGNTELCTIHGWPLRFLCGGTSHNYWSNVADNNNGTYVEMRYGAIAGAVLESQEQVTCVR